MIEDDKGSGTLMSKAEVWKKVCELVCPPNGTYEPACETPTQFEKLHPASARRFNEFVAWCVELDKKEALALFFTAFPVPEELDMPLRAKLKSNAAEALLLEKLAAEDCALKTLVLCAAGPNWPGALQRNQSIESLQIVARDPFDAAWLAYAQTETTLVTLALHCWKGTPDLSDCLKLLSGFAENSKQLESIHLAGVDLATASVAELGVKVLHAFRNHAKLKSLSFDDCALPDNVNELLERRGLEVKKTRCTYY
ncbi:hypothetical protein VARIO8X_150035 [Burkholderiales bacterium 8X]|nr:hypothetical protein VARIO8X_150035 [Burkholderiales bacterium 8X]